MISKSNTTQNLMDEDDVDTLFNIDISQSASRRSILSRASTVYCEQRPSTMYYDLSNDMDHKRISIMTQGSNHSTNFNNFPPGRRSSMVQHPGTFLESRKMNYSRMHQSSLNSVAEEKEVNRLSTKKNSVSSNRKKSSTVLTDFIVNDPQGRRGAIIPEKANSFNQNVQSLQVKQWETIHEFESEEQQKYLVYQSLKSKSIAIFYLMLFSLVLMGLDLRVTRQAFLTSKTNIQRFVIPSCWVTLSEPLDKEKTIDRDDVIEFTYDLLRDPLAVNYFGSDKYFGEKEKKKHKISRFSNCTTNFENSTTNYINATKRAEISYYENFITRKMLLGNLVGQRSSLIHVLQNIWSRKRIAGDFRFHPLTSEQNTTKNPKPNTLRSLKTLNNPQNSPESQKLYLQILSIRFLASITTITMIIYLTLYYSNIAKLNVMKHIVCEQTPIHKHPGLIRKFTGSILITVLHVPPGDYFMEISGKYPLQLFTIFRLLHTIKWLRETNPLRYNRMTEILCIIGSVKVRDKFLMKIPFMRKPLTSIIYTYLIILTISTFTIYSLERQLMSGYCLTFQQSLWIVMVTSTNVGYDDVIVGTALSKTMLAFTSISGIAIMALLVNRLMNGVDGGGGVGAEVTRRLFA